VTAESRRTPRLDECYATTVAIARACPAAAREITAAGPARSAERVPNRRERDPGQAVDAPATALQVFLLVGGDSRAFADTPAQSLTITVHDFYWPAERNLTLRGVPVP